MGRRGKGKEGRSTLRTRADPPMAPGIRLRGHWSDPPALTVATPRALVPIAALSRPDPLAGAPESVDGSAGTTFFQGSCSPGAAPLLIQLGPPAKAPSAHTSPSARRLSRLRFRDSEQGAHGPMIQLDPPPPRGQARPETQEARAWQTVSAHLLPGVRGPGPSSAGINHVDPVRSCLFR
ncbi:hypothetical protein NDU88_004712 [Pleurodeles waltl]|uniref:Uncharacterized protein n=1 Tax=Pleurodeles waltl TaxID=8319 RepID=A0AAV7RLR2_PLEWA|nr:hypothetical protein NDU88_004712 [Pleurodeles waltl]